MVGPSLSGKTTLVDLIAGWAEADEGEIERDDAGLPLGDWSKLAVIPQGLALLGELSVVENITLALVGWGRRAPARSTTASTRSTSPRCATAIPTRSRSASASG